MPLSLDNGGIDRLTHYFWCYEDIYSYKKNLFLKCKKIALLSENLAANIWNFSKFFQFSWKLE